MGSVDFRIPEEKLPQCWSDDVRMNALFAPFRLKIANPESWEMKMKFWSEMLRQWCRHKKDPIVSAADAKLAFQRKGQTPACLEIVIEECFRNGDLSPISKYQHILHNGPEGWLSWGARLAFKPAAFALVAVSSLLPAKQAIDSYGLPKASIDGTQRFVMECVVQELATEFLENFPTGVERLGTINELMRGGGWKQSRETFEIVLGWLVSQGLAVKKGDIVKLGEASSAKPSPISESDEALARLLSSEHRLETDLVKYTNDVEQATVDAKAALQLGNRVAAKNHLRRKHKLQERADKTEAALENIRQMVHSMRDVQVNSEVFDTYKVGAQAMKRDMKDAGLDEDKVHDTMDELKEVMESCNEIERTLSGPVDDYDAEELEKELQDLLSSGSAPNAGGTPTKPQKKEVPIRLPSPPSSLPKPRTSSESTFVFDGEARMLAELNDLDVEEASPKARVRVKETIGEEAKGTPTKVQKPSKEWYPKEKDFALDNSLDRLCQDFVELKMDQRLHPGQKLQVNFGNTPGLYGADFQVQDHTLTDRVWLFNAMDCNRNIETDLAASTEYFSSESPGKSGGSFQMAPGGERSAQTTRKTSTDDLQKRLDKLRSFN